MTPRCRRSTKATGTNRGSRPGNSTRSTRVARARCRIPSLHRQGSDAAGGSDDSLTINEYDEWGNPADRAASDYQLTSPYDQMWFYAVRNSHCRASPSSARQGSMAWPPPIPVAVHFTAGFLEHRSSPFDTGDLRQVLNQPCGRMADLRGGLFVADAEPEPGLQRRAQPSQPRKAIWLEPERARLTQRRGKPRRIPQRDVRGGEPAEAQPTDQVPLGGQARDACPCLAHDILGDEPSELRIIEVVRMARRAPAVRHEDQGQWRDASALDQRREDRQRLNAVSVVLAVEQHAQRVGGLRPLDEPCGTHVLARRARDGQFLLDHASYPTARPLDAAQLDVRVSVPQSQSRTSTRRQPAKL